MRVVYLVARANRGETATATVERWTRELAGALPKLSQDPTTTDFNR